MISKETVGNKVNQSSNALPLAALSSNLLELELLLRQEDDGSRAGEATAVVRHLRRSLDQITFLYGTARRLGQNLALHEVSRVLVDILCTQHCSFVVILLSEAELGPYVYHDMRGVKEPLRFLGEQCPLPLWGDLAHALVRRLDAEEPDYLVISDLAHSLRPKVEEFPWLERAGSMMIVPLRKDHVAMGALILGRPEANGFEDVEACTGLAEVAGAAAMALYNAKVRHELDACAGKLVGLQLFTRSLPITAPMCDLLVAIANNIADLLVGVEVFVLIRRKHLPEVTAGALMPHFVDLSWADLCILSNCPQPSADLLHTSLHRLVTWTIEAGQPLFLDPQPEYAAPEELYYNEAGQALLVPLNSGEEALGAVFAVSRDSTRLFNDHDLAMMRTMANMAAAIFKLRLAYPCGLTR
jgi:GAF domain-containing protein